MDNSIQRMLEISGIKDTPLERVNNRVVTSLMNEVTTADGITYGIFNEKNKFHVKKQVDGEYKYMVNESVAHKHSFDTYGAALQRLNVLIKDANTRHGIGSNVDIFTPKKKVV